MGRRIRKIIGVVLVALSIVLTQIPVFGVEAESVTSSDFQMDGTTLVKYTGTAASVTLSGNVKKIESEAFAGNTAVQTVTIGSGVESVGASAFKGCTNLTVVSIGDDTVTIGQAAFADCPSLSKVTIGSGLKDLGNGAFAGDTDLSSVSFSSDNTAFTCSDGAIYNKKDKSVLYVLLSGRTDSSYSMPSSVTTIKPYAFWGDKNLQSVSISSNVAEISSYAFSNCVNLTSVEIPYSVKTIGLKAFANDIRLRYIEIPPSVSSIHATAFDGCTKLVIGAVEGSVAYNYAQNLVLEDIDVAEYEDTDMDTIAATDADETDDEDADDSDEEDTDDADADTDETATGSSGTVDYYHEVTHLNPLETEEDDSVKGKTRIVGNQAFVIIDNAAATVNSGSLTQVEGVVSGETGDTIADLSDEKSTSSFAKYEVTDDAVASQAYYRSTDTTLSVPDGVTTISDFAYARSSITEARVPEGVTSIGYAAFYHCDDLAEIFLPDSLQEVAPYAFAKTAWLADWEENGANDFLIVGDGILLSYKGNDTSVIIPDTVRLIGPDAFENHTEILSVTIPDSVEIIGEEAFYGCSNLSEIVWGSNVREIRDRAFAGCALTQITIPASVESIGLLAFERTSVSASNADMTVTFEGSKIPTLSYEKTATKLYNDDYRGLAFAGTSTAIVPQGVTAEDLIGTVLDASVSGFRGVVYTTEENGSLSVVQSQLGEDTAVTDSEYAENDTDVQVIIQLDTNAIAAFEESAATLDGSTDTYTLEISDSSTAETALTAALSDVYGADWQESIGNLVSLDFTLTENDSGIPISSLGRQSLTLTIPLPSGIRTDNLHVITLDDDGQPEEVPVRLSQIEGTDCLVMTISHFSPYGIYNYGTASADGTKDASPDTGDYGINPKWFLCAGVLALGLALFFWRGKKFTA